MSGWRGGCLSCPPGHPNRISCVAAQGGCLGFPRLPAVPTAGRGRSEA